MKRLFLFALFLLLCHCPLVGQQYVFHAYRQSDGLENLSTFFIRQDQQGFLWLGTENGLYRFSGTDFERLDTTRGLPETLVTDLYIDPAGRVWVGTLKNLYRWTGQTFEPALASGEALPIEKDASISALDASHLLIVRHKSLLLLEYSDQEKSWSSKPFFSGQQRQLHTELSAIRSIYVTRQGEIWIGCAEKLCQYSHGQLRIWDSGKGVPTDKWSTFLESRHGDIWVQGNHNLIELPYGTVSFQDRTYAGYKRDVIYTRRPLAEDESGNILASGDKGILRWNGEQWQSINQANGLDEGHITDFLFDETGDLWLGTVGRGLVHWIGYRNWEHWTSHQGLPSDQILTTFSNRQGQLYIGTASGIGILDKTHRQIASLRHSIPETNQQVSAFVEDEQHNLWTATYSGSLIRIDRQTQRSALIATLPLIYHLIRDTSGRIWICTNRDLYVVDHPGPEAKPRLVEEAAAFAGDNYHMAVNGCLMQSGALWFLSHNGLMRYESGVWSRPSVDGLTAQTHLDLMACTGKDAFWVAGGNGGLWRIKEEGQRATASYLPMGANLNHAELLSVAEDHRGWLWIGTDFGVAAWNGTQWRVINQESGFIWNDTTQDAIMEDSDGTIWIGTSVGLAHLLRPEQIFQPIHLRVYVTNVAQNGKLLPSSSSFLLPWSRDAILFHVGAPSYLNASSLVFRYRLVGLNESWETTTDTDIRYAALPPGSYKLEVTAANKTLNTVTDTTVVAFRILPPWWQSNLFYTFCALLFSVLIFLLYRWRTHRLLVQQYRLETLVQQRTAELELSKEQLRKQAMYDGLTGLLNRTAILDVLNQQIEHSVRKHTSLAVILADLDHFKSINDNYGHPAGDQVLREIARRIKTSLHPHEFVGRYGGEELLLIFSGTYSSQTDPNFTDRLRELHNSISATPVRVTSHKGEDVELTITCSIGVSWVKTEIDYAPHKGAQWAEQLLHLSDAALYRAKHLGRNRIEFAQ